LHSSHSHPCESTLSGLHHGNGICATSGVQRSDHRTNANASGGVFELLLDTFDFEIASFSFSYPLSSLLGHSIAPGRPPLTARTFPPSCKGLGHHHERSRTGRNRFAWPDHCHSRSTVRSQTDADCSCTACCELLHVPTESPVESEPSGCNDRNHNQQFNQSETFATSLSNQRPLNIFYVSFLQKSDLTQQPI